MHMMEEPSSPLTSVAGSIESPSFSRSRTASPSRCSTADTSSRSLSPAQTVVSGIQSPTKDSAIFSDSSVQKRPTDATDGSLPRKKRRTSPPKERTTSYVDLTKPNEELTEEDNQQIDQLLSALRKKKKVVVVAGAGISVSAGIPDFRSATGLFSTLRNQHKIKASGKHLFDASVYRHNSSTQSFHTMVREMAHMSKQAQPTPFHHLVASLAQEGRLLRLYSQNIDGIDTSMQPLATNVPLNPKGPWPATVQLHGGLEKMVCTKCGQVQPFNGQIFDGPEAPLCETCEADDEVRTAHAGKRSHGIGRLRPRFVLYNEFNPDEEAIGNVSSADLKARPDAVIVVGTTLKVPGTRRLVKELCKVARGRRNGFTTWINVDPEPKGVDFKDCWDLVVKAKCDSVANLAALPPWDCPVGDDYHVSSEQDMVNQELLSKSRLKIEISPRSSSPVSISQELPGQPSEPGKTLESEEAHIHLPTPPRSGVKIVLKTKPPQGNAVANTTASNPKTKKPAKPRVRKPKVPTKPTVPKNSVKQAFKTSKVSAQPVLAKATKVIGVAPTTQLLPKDMLPNSTSIAVRSANSDTFSYSKTTGGQIICGNDAAANKHEPRETIRPSSVPHSMSNIID